MVLSFSNPLMVSFWFAQQQGTAWVWPDVVLHFLDPHLEEWADTVNVPIPHQLFGGHCLMLSLH